MSSDVWGSFHINSSVNGKRTRRHWMPRLTSGQNMNVKNLDSEVREHRMYAAIMTAP